MGSIHRVAMQRRLNNLIHLLSGDLRFAPASRFFLWEFSRATKRDDGSGGGEAGVLPPVDLAGTPAPANPNLTVRLVVRLFESVSVADDCPLTAKRT
jgi:hypothetical protein